MRPGSPVTRNTRVTTSRPSGRPRRGGRGIHRATTPTSCPAPTFAFTGQRATTSPRHPRVGNDTRPVALPGSSVRSTSCCSPGRSEATQRSVMVVRLQQPTAIPLAQAIAVTAQVDRRRTHPAASRSGNRMTGSRKRERPVTRPAPYATSRIMAPGGARINLRVGGRCVARAPPAEVLRRPAPRSRSDAAAHRARPR